MEKRNTAFTLIELLAVLAIIGILMGLLFPAISDAMQSAKKVQAKNDLVQMKTAITGFYTEYSQYPDIGSSTAGTDTQIGGDSDKTSQAKLIAVLRYDKDGPHGALVKQVNPRGIIFFQPKQDRPDSTTPKGVLGNDGVLYDPWGHAFIFVIDTNYDNLLGDETSGITLPYSDMPHPISTTIIGWSVGKDGELGKNGKQSGSDDPTSW